MDFEKRKEVAEWLNKLGYDIEFDKDGLWMEDYRFTEHKTKDVIDIILAWSDRKEFKTSEQLKHDALLEGVKTIRSSEDIYEEAKNEVLDSGNFGLETMAKIGIEKAQKEMFYYVYSEAEKEPCNKRLISFFDKLDKELLI